MRLEGVVVLFGGAGSRVGEVLEDGGEGGRVVLENGGVGENVGVRGAGLAEIDEGGGQERFGESVGGGPDFLVGALGGENGDRGWGLGDAVKVDGEVAVTIAVFDEAELNVEEFGVEDGHFGGFARKASFCGVAERKVDSSFADGVLLRC